MANRCETPCPFDRKRLLEDCDDEESFACRCLHVFVRDTQTDMNGIAAAMQKNDFACIARLAHRIKGASASIRAEFLRRQAAELEEHGGKLDSAAAGECFVHLKNEFESFKKFIDALPMLREAEDCHSSFSEASGMKGR